MGTEFFWFYDLLVAAILIGVTFKSFRKGGVAVIISTAAIVVSFVLAFFGSSIIADKIYEGWIAEPLTDYIDETLDDALGDIPLASLGEIDMEKAVVGGKFLSTIEPEFDSSGTAVLDLSDVDLTETGITSADLSLFGIGEDFDYSQIKIGSVEIERDEYEKRGLGELVLAHVLAANVSSGELYTAFEQVGDKISEVIPLVFGGFSGDISSGRSSALYKLVLSITDVGSGNHGSAVLAEIVDPIVRVPIRIAVFVLIFALAAIVLNLIASASRIINHIPVVASVNEALGGLLGLVKAMIIVLLVCIGVQLLISVTGNELVFLNTNTIDKTILFKHIYYFDFIDFFNSYTHI